VTAPSLSSLLSKVQTGEDLTEAETSDAISAIMEAQAPEQQVKEFLLALREKGEALPEVVGAARAMRQHAVPLEVRVEGVLVDTCGTGGDGLKTVNISTLAALVVAGAGVAVAKHGNRSVTSACGSADLLEALGVKIDVPTEVVRQCIEETGFGFLFAPRFHPAMKAVAPIRKALGVPTIFNLLGPLTNPAGVRYQVVGVADEKKLDLYAQALEALGAIRVLVVHGTDGQDEISTTGSTEVAELQMERMQIRVLHYAITPDRFGIQASVLEDLRGGSPAENARIAQEVLTGARGPVRDAVLLNAAAALYVAGAAQDIAAGLAMAVESVDKGEARDVLERVREIASAPTGPRNDARR